MVVGFAWLLTLPSKSGLDPLPMNNIDKILHELLTDRKNATFNLAYG